MSLRVSYPPCVYISVWGRRWWSAGGDGFEEEEDDSSSETDTCTGVKR